MINLELSRATMLFIQNSDKQANTRALNAIKNRNYHVKNAIVSQVTTINDTALVAIRADGAQIKIIIDKNELDAVYRDPIGYAVKEMEKEK